EEVPQPSADGRRARHDGDRPAAPERQAAGQEDRRARLDPRGQQGDQQHHPLGRRGALQDAPGLREVAGVTETHEHATGSPEASGPRASGSLMPHESSRKLAAQKTMSRHPSAFAPLANRAFRGIWIANLLGNVGGWMQTTGAAWEMTSLTTEPIYVAL